MVVFFDLGNTLVAGASQSARRLLGERLRLSEKEVKPAGRLIMTHHATDPHSLAEALRPILPGHDYTRILRAVEELWQEQMECVRVASGAVSLLRLLKAGGFRLGIISNTWHPFYMGFRRACSELTGLLDYSILSYNIGCKKPSIEIFLRAVRESGESAGSCWMVGDSYELDMDPARKVGMRTVWVLSRPESERTILAQALRGEKPLPDWVAEDLPEAMRYFDTLKGNR